MRGTFLIPEAQVKADLSSLATVSLSGVSLWMHNANMWADTYMPLITALGILSGAIMTAWYYRSIIKQRKREYDLKARQQRRVDDNED
jgi:uncharacterized membrane protein